MQKKLNEDFIEKYSEEFAAKISEDFYASHSHINGQEILNATPSKQVNFFVIKLLFNNWQQESQRLESPFFNYSAPEVKEALLQFMNVLSRFIKVGRKEFESLLQDAVRDTLFLMMSPNVYMEIEFDRKGAEELTDKTAKSILKYIKVAKEDFTSYFQANIGIDKDDIEIDDDIISDSLLEEEIAKLNQIMPLTLKKLEEGDDDEEDLLNVEEDDLMSPTIARSSESDQQDEIELENKEEEEEVTTQLPEERVITENEEVESTEVEISSSQEVEVEELSGEEEESSIETDTEEEESKVETEEDSIPENETVESTEEAKSVKEEEEEDSETVQAPPSNVNIITNMAPGEEDDEDDDEVLNDKFEDPLSAPTIAEAHEGKEDSMMAAISVNHRYMFINELFDGEADLFTDAIAKIEECNSFDESVEVLVQNYAKDYHWDMNSDEVKELLKIIFRRFR